MKQTEFNALVNYTTVTAAKSATTAGDRFLLNETQIFQDGTMPSSKTGKLQGRQQNAVAVRHKVMYYERDDTDIGYHPCYDLIESDEGTDQTRTATRPGVTRDARRDDDDRRNYNGSQWA